MVSNFSFDYKMSDAGFSTIEDGEDHELCKALMHQSLYQVCLLLSLNDVFI